MSYPNPAEAVRAWVHGWTVSRGAADPVRQPWGYTVDVGLPDQVMRHVLPDADEAAVRKITEDTTAPAVWLKTFVPPHTLEPWLAPGWSLAGGPGFLMAATPRAAGAGVPPGAIDGYRLRTWSRGGVIHALVRTADGAFAARGQIAVTGRTAVADRISTDPAHRRRGLGRLVMRTLADAAAAEGAEAAVLGATPDGRALYETLGWRVLAPLTGAMRS